MFQPEKPQTSQSMKSAPASSIMVYNVLHMTGTGGCIILHEWLKLNRLMSLALSLAKEFQSSRYEPRPLQS